MYFKDRYDADIKLIPLLEKYSFDPAVVLAVPRGGVPIGYVIAKKFGFPLDVILTKKIGHPMSSEFAVGAVSLEDCIVDRSQNLPQHYIDTETLRIRELLRERYSLYTGNRAPVDLKNKSAIIVDDGIATGYTITATIQMLRKKKPARIILAIPVAPPETARKISKMVDEFICLTLPEDFSGVGQFYLDFTPVSDEEVVDYLQKANELISN